MNKTKSKTERAKKLFVEGFNCCQAVFVPFAMELGLSKAKSLKLASGFGAGMSFNGETCGVVVAAHLAIGLQTGYNKPDDLQSKENAKNLIKEYRQKFILKNGSCSCKELLAANTAIDEDLKYLRENEIFKQKCPGFVSDSAEILTQLFQEQPHAGTME